MTATFEQGQLITLDFTVTNAAGAPIAPTTLVLTVLDPTASTSTYTPAADSVGVYHQDLTPALPGAWRYRWVTTGIGQTAQEGGFTVLAPFSTVAVDVSPNDVAQFLQQRLRTRDGNPAGTFTATTVPNLADVQGLITKVYDDVTGGLGTIPAPLLGLTRFVVELGTASLVLLQFYEADRAYTDLEARYQAALMRLREAVDSAITSGDPNAVSAEDGAGKGGAERPPAPAFSFPTIRPERFISGYPVPVTTLREPY